MDENSKNIRELTEAMHAERDIRIRNRMMAVLRALKGHSTKIASDFTNVDQQTVQLWVARFDEGGIGGLRDASGRGRASRARYGRIRKLADRLAGRFFWSLDGLKAAIIAILGREMGNRLKGYLVA